MFSSKHRRWQENSPPKKILIIRLHALGDIAITLSFIESISAQLEYPIIDYLVHDNYAHFLKPIRKIRQIFSIKGNRMRDQFFHTLYLLPLLRKHRYDVILDLQNNPISRYIRNYLSPRAWASFDRFSNKTAFLRNQETIRQCLDVDSEHHVPELRKKMSDSGYDDKKFVLLNPAGAWPTRIWGEDKFIELAELWTGYDTKTQFILIGRRELLSRTQKIRQELGENCINMIDRTQISELLGLMNNIICTISEDSGLMHISSLMKRPTVALLGSSRSDWTSLTGLHTVTFNSDDLECGNCMSESCSRGDMFCLRRIRPETVLKKSLDLIKADTEL